MKLTDRRMDAAENLRRTYLALGRALDGAIIEQDGFTACLSNIGHPICNFAIGLDLDPWSARKLASVAIQRPCFCVYRGPADRPEHATDLLELAGFRQTYSLAVMVGPGEDRGEVIEMVPAETHAERLEIGRFIGDQFFSRQHEDFRRTVAIASADAPSLQLYGIWSGQQRIAALTLSRDHMVGLYNLCVHPAFRGLGWGTSAVQATMALAAQTGSDITLQCEPKLVPWYERLGCKIVGTVEVYDLAESNKTDIIK